MGNERALTNGNAGNRLGNRKPWSRALDTEVLQNPNLLRRLARKTFAMALKGDIDAIKEIGNRLDGKAVQASEVSVTGGVAMFQGMSREDILQAIRLRLEGDAIVAKALGLPATFALPAPADEAQPAIEHVATGQPVR